MIFVDLANAICGFIFWSSHTHHEADFCLFGFLPMVFVNFGNAISGHTNGRTNTRKADL
jgi:hypothetical protein